MADHNSSDHGSGMDYAEHEATFKFFVGLTKWGTIGIVVLLLLMAKFLVY